MLVSANELVNELLNPVLKPGADVAMYNRLADEVRRKLNILFAFIR
jgi:hypothetical protein